jgi:hypothetical protein
VDSKIIKIRLKAIKKILNSIYDKKDKARIWKKQIWFIEGINEEKWYCKIRPEIKAPEIDDLDKVKFEDLLWVELINIWDIVEYNLK